MVRAELLNDKVSIRFGQLAADSEFIISDGAAAFINGTWGWPSITATNMPQGGPAYPLATPGLRIAYAPNDQLTLMVGAYNGRPAGSCPDKEDPQDCNDHGLDFPTADPKLLMFEGAYKYNQGNGELPGTIKVGGWRNYGSFLHQRLDANGGEIAISGNDPAVLNGDHGLYAILDQMIYRLQGAGDPKGVSIFGRIIGAPEDRNPVAYLLGGRLYVHRTDGGATERYARHRLRAHRDLRRSCRQRLRRRGDDHHPELRGRG